MSRIDYRKTFAGIARFFPLNFLRKMAGQNLIHPFYHAVSDNPPSHLKHLYPIKTIKRFREDLEFYLKNFNPVLPEKLLNKDLIKSKEPVFLLSFDDGLREVKDHIIPVLLEKGVSAIFFINNSFIDNRDLFFRYKASLLVEHLVETTQEVSVLNEISDILQVSDNDKNIIIQNILGIGYGQRRILDQLASLLGIDFSDYLKKQKPYLTSREITDIKNKGFVIGSHSYDHPDFASLNDEDQIREVNRSAKDISTRFDLDYHYFSFPFTDDGISGKVMESLHSKEKGIIDLSFGTAGLKKPEPFPHFQRIPVEKSVQNASDYLKSEYFYYLLKEFIGKNNLSRK